ncbi:MAG: hypothetical protein ACPGSD_04900 [Flavobacteriales bacterium]
MSFNPKTFSQIIQSKYIEYETQIGEVFCHVFNRDKNKSDFENFEFEIKHFDFFDYNKLDEKGLVELNLDQAKSAIISSIIKETKYDTHFIEWELGEKYSDELLAEFEKVNKILSNASFNHKFYSENKVNENELEMTDWVGFSRDYRYDYGFIIVSEKKIAILWFGDEG